MLKWLEVTPDYRCNNRCVGCFSVQEGGPSMTSRELEGALRLGRARGARWLWIGGGEPTMRRDLFAIAAAARKLGYERVKLQTNGMLLAYAEFADRAAASGITEVNFSIKGATAETHDRLTRTPGCHELMSKGMAEVRRLGLGMEGDILVYAGNAAEIPAMVRAYTELGVARYNLWLLCAAGSADAAREAAPEVPRIADIMPHITAAMDLHLSERADFITSLHTPPCTIPAPYHAAAFHAPELGLLVTNPGGFAFPLEESPIEGGTYFPACDGCSLRARCGGARADYVAIHGEAEFQPVRGD